jgi:hypothetical protein
MGEYVRVDWENAQTDSNLEVAVPLDSFQSWYDAFLSLITNGEHLTVNAKMLKMSQDYGLNGF